MLPPAIAHADLACARLVGPRPITLDPEVLRQLQSREGANLNISIADAKVELIKLFYDSRPTMQLPWILVLSSEIVDASDLLLACPEFAGHNAMYAGRPCSGGGEHQRDPHLLPLNEMLPVRHKFLENFPGSTTNTSRTRM